MQTATHPSVSIPLPNSGADKLSFAGHLPFVANSFKVFFLLVCLLFAGAVLAQTTYYVKTTGGDEASGASWTEAFQTLQKALTTAGSGDQIWVAAGTYYPEDPGQLSDDYRASFLLKNGVAIYGGFAGNETGLSQRNWQTNVTILSGDYGLGPADNATYVVKGNGTNSTAILDGFTITGGGKNGVFNSYSSPTFANCTFSKNYEAGMANYDSSPTLTNCRFSENGRDYDSKGGMANYRSSPTLTDCSFSNNEGFEGGGGMSNFNSNPVLTACSFSGNSTGNWGGAIYNKFSTPTLISCSFRGNRAEYNGGAIANLASSPSLVNCSFVGNTARFNGGGMYTYSYPNAVSSPTLVNCSFTTNVATGAAGFSFSGYGGGLCNLASTPTLINCIVWGNRALYDEEINNIDGSVSAITYSIVRGGYSGTGNKDQDPLFVDTAAGDLHLQACSPAIDAGADAATNNATDRDGNPRKIDAIAGGSGIDMGAYEFQGDLDADNDGYAYCNNEDCNDANAAEHPGQTWYKDADNDGYNDGTTQTGCTRPAGYKLASELTATTGDCNDNNASVHSPLPFYKDADGDGYGNAAIITSVCASTPPAGYVGNNKDCNDSDPAISPAAVEVCGNKVDDNCNGTRDENTCFACQNATGLTTINITAATAQLNWTARANPTQWQMQYKTTKQGSQWTDVLLTGNIRTVKLTGLLSKQDYNWHIRAKCNGAWTSYSTTVGFKTTATQSSTLLTSTSTVKEQVKESTTGLELRLAPNPARTNTTLIVRSDEIRTAVTLEVFDALGRLVETRKTAANTTLTLGARYQPGTYYIQAVQGNRQKQSTLIKISN